MSYNFTYHDLLIFIFTFNIKFFHHFCQQAISGKYKQFQPIRVFTTPYKQYSNNKQSQNKVLCVYDVDR